MTWVLVVVSVVVAAGLCISYLDRAEARKIKAAARLFARTHYQDDLVAVAVYEAFCEEFGLGVRDIQPFHHIAREFGVDEDWESEALRHNLQERFNVQIPEDWLPFDCTIDELFRLAKSHVGPVQGNCPHFNLGDTEA